jgi:hypothetical protein
MADIWQKELEMTDLESRLQAEQELVNASGELRDAINRNPRTAQEEYKAAQRFVTAYEAAVRLRQSL